ncbi:MULTISPECIES: hypothetical protein [unclassified Paraburkholderia]|uniref:hypothetical protein n=1 Tax=unclassified Paraburkholderia TaxID=2615204 RepID=UPI002AB28B43|nr:MULTISPECIES: hypothetical protein [unclassified Paraburkholderia]
METTEQKARPAHHSRAGTEGQLIAFLTLLPRLIADCLTATCVMGEAGVGLHPPVQAAAHRAGRVVVLQCCASDANPNDVLRQVITRTKTLNLADHGVLVVRHPERVRNAESFAPALKRVAASTGMFLVCEVERGRRAHDFTYAFARRARGGLAAMPPIRIENMSAADARRILSAWWSVEFPGRWMPEHLPNTLRGVSEGHVEQFWHAWHFCVPLFSARDFVSPTEIWEFLRPDGTGDAEMNAPRGPNYPSPDIVHAAEEIIDTHVRT